MIFSLVSIKSNDMCNNSGKINRTWIKVDANTRFTASISFVHMNIELRSLRVFKALTFMVGSFDLQKMTVKVKFLWIANSRNILLNKSCKRLSVFMLSIRCYQRWQDKLSDNTQFAHRITLTVSNKVNNTSHHHTIWSKHSLIKNFHNLYIKYFFRFFT